MEITKAIVMIMIRVLITGNMIIVIMEIVLMMVIIIACGFTIPGGCPGGNKFGLWLSWSL